MKTHRSPAHIQRFITAKTAALLLCLILAVAVSADAAQSEAPAGSNAETCRKPDGTTVNGTPGWCKRGQGTCSPGMRGRCGKQRGDWYGARQPVTSADEALALLRNYYAGQEYTVSGVIEKRWGFRADVLDKNGAAVDRVMIDKRTGRIRSMN